MPCRRQIPPEFSTKSPRLDEVDRKPNIRTIWTRKCYVTMSLDWLLVILAIFAFAVLEIFVEIDCQKESPVSLSSRPRVQPYVEDRIRSTLVIYGKLVGASDGV